MQQQLAWKVWVQTISSTGCIDFLTPTQLLLLQAELLKSLLADQIQARVLEIRQSIQHNTLTV